MRLYSWCYMYAFNQILGIPDACSKEVEELSSLASVFQRLRNEWSGKEVLDRKLHSEVLLQYLETGKTLTSGVNLF